MGKAPINMSTISFEWEATFNAFPDPVSIHDNQFRIIKVNPALASLLKEKPENIIGKKCHQLIHGSDKPVEICPHVQTMERHYDQENSFQQKRRRLGGAALILRLVPPCPALQGGDKGPLGINLE
jgi:PAS domain S-box-containing protein